MFDFLDHMNTDKIYDSMVFRNENKLKTNYKMQTKDMKDAIKNIDDVDNSKD